MRQSEKTLRRLPERSDRVKLELVRPGTDESPIPSPGGQGSPVARPVLTAQLEPFHRIARELPPLFERHWREIALHQDTIPLEPDWNRYYAEAESRTLQVRTARCGKVLVGYIFNLVGPHRHYRSTLHAEIEMFWLDKAYRGGLFPLRWFKANDSVLREMGVKRISVAVKNGYHDGRVGLIFKRLSYSPVETVYSKVL